MNEPASRSRRLPRPASLRRTFLGAAVIGSMMLAAGCHTGPGPQHTEADGGGKTPYERALAITQCMRQNGDAPFPDPGSNGAFPASAQKNRSSPSYQAAAKACEGLPVPCTSEPPGTGTLAGIPCPRRPVGSPGA
jgi:hypothetical protein